MKLSAIVICKDEEVNIKRCLDSLSWIPEVVVVDSHSKDQTPQIAKSYDNVKFIDSDWLGYSKTKTLAISHTTNDWILWLDADEEVTAELKEEIIKTLNDLSFSAYSIHRLNWFMGNVVNYSGWGKDWVFRFFNKNKCKFDDKNVHESLIIEGETSKLKGRLNHYTYKNFNDYITKFHKYNELSAYDKAPKTTKVNGYHLFIKPIFRFFRHYILQLGFLDGKVGLILSSMSGISIFFRYVKIYRIQNGEK